MIINNGVCECCGSGSGDCICTLCGKCQDGASQLINIVITSASGPVALYFFCGIPGVSGSGTAGPYSATNPIVNDSIDYIGLVGAFSFVITCVGNDVCLSFGINSGSPPYAMAFCDTPTTYIFPHGGISCTDPGDVTFTKGPIICDVDGFVSMDFTVDLGSDGSFSGTVFR